MKTFDTIKDMNRYVIDNKLIIYGSSGDRYYITNDEGTDKRVFLIQEQNENIIGNGIT